MKDYVVASLKIVVGAEYKRERERNRAIWDF